MLSLQAALSEERSMNRLSTIAGADASKKRKRDVYDDGIGEVHAAAKELKLWCTNRSDPPPPGGEVDDDIELQLEDSPLPPEWQRCLDIKSGRIHFYNTTTQRKTTKDPRLRTEPPPRSRPALSLDLDLNLGCESPTTEQDERKQEVEQQPQRLHANKKQRHGGTSPASWSTTAVADPFCSEMMATVCRRCHMLVMMCRSTPSCPNCKFLHSTHDEVAAAGMPLTALEKPGLRQIDTLEGVLVGNKMWMK